MLRISKYFEKRERTYPQDVKGRFRSIKNISGIIYLLIFFLFPYIRWNRGLDLPDQAILIDIVNSRGYFFFIKIWPEEVYYLAGILIFAATALFFITSLFGRIWCGYSCPQTVWTDIFVKVERLFQGDRNDRIIMDRKNNFNKFIRKLATHIVWLIISLITGFGFVLYFNDAYLVTYDTLNFDLSVNVASWIFGITGMTYMMAGFAREQVCNYMCPYARFQSVMFDDDTLIVTYDQKRGEPRAKYKIGDPMEERGHCIECKQCVVVCPQNIDIRNGLQMECIACGLCIDACDITMEKIGLPKGLIRYDTANHMKNPKSKRTKFSIIKTRTFYYSFILGIVGATIIYSLAFRANLDIKIIPNRNPMFVTLANGDIRNGYEFRIYNKSDRDKIYKIDINGKLKPQIKIQTPQNIDLDNIRIRSDSIKNIRLFISYKKSELDFSKNSKILKVKITEKKSKESIAKDSIFIYNK